MDQSVPFLLRSDKRFNVAYGAAPGTGKTTLLASLFAALKAAGYDYELVPEEHRQKMNTIGRYTSIAERFPLMLEQVRLEDQTVARHGFLTDSPPINFYGGAKFNNQGHRSERDQYFLQALYNFCKYTAGRYSLLVLCKDPFKGIPYKTDNVRSTPDPKAVRKKNWLIINAAQEIFPKEKIVFVEGTPSERLTQVFVRIMASNVLRDNPEPPKTYASQVPETPLGRKSRH